MVSRAILAVLALCVAGCDEQLPAAPGDATGTSATGERPPVASPDSCAIVTSIVTFAALPDSPQRLEATYMGTDHARWWFGTLARGQETDRRMRYRRGDEVYGIELGTDESITFDALHAQNVTLQLELRRAALLWPEGFDWRGTESSRRAPAANDSGTLVVELEGGVPTAFRSELSEHTAFERLEVRTWSDELHPSELALFLDGELVWTERVVRFQRDCRFASFYFVPPDRRALADAGDASQLDRLTHLDLAARATKRIALEVASWDEALERAAALLTRERAAHELAGHAFEADLEMRPRALLVHLDASEAPLPEGFVESPAGSAVAVLLSSAAKLTAGRLEALRAHLPEDARGGPPIVRFAAEDPRGKPVQLLLESR